MTLAYIGVGSNINPEKNVKESLRLLALQVQVLRISTVYHTAPEQRPDQPWYYNCVAEIETELRPEELKYCLLRRIEKRLGRVRTSDKFASRPIDLDIVLYGDPSPTTRGISRLDRDTARRPFIAAALLELCPDLKFPNDEFLMEESAADLCPENSSASSSEND